MAKRRFSIYIERDELDFLKREAISQRLSVAQVMRNLINKIRGKK